MIAQFLLDYRCLSLVELSEKYGKAYMSFPTENDIITYLKGKNQLESAIDPEWKPGDSDERFVYLNRCLGNQNMFEVFNIFRNMKVSEEKFNRLEDAVRMKFFRVILSLRASRR